MGGKLMNAELYEKIVTDRLVFGVPAKKIAQDIGKNPMTITAVTLAFEAVKAADWDKCVHIIDKYKAPLALFTWASDKLGVELPKTLEAAYEERKAKERESKAQKRHQSEPQESTPASAPELPKEDNTGLYMIKLLEAVNKQNELLEQLYDVVIPKWTGDMKDNVNVNADMLNQSLKRIDDKLEAIKINVRKRGL